jgi:hypothetical protein
MNKGKLTDFFETGAWRGAGKASFMNMKKGISS